eukprot:TRINITY_DN50873_c0_g1_i1.p1 TRINITY_DN50873_c0_g1~~TRINITY_DN50873_c0_g1_i1.p1  ORF type:complete len:464 (-),score=47.72 TRINITY_DN50873_c0_g1_i1:27-1418(-)
MVAQSKLELLGVAGLAAVTLAGLPYAIKSIRGKTKTASDGTTTDYEFGGPPGAFATMLSLPGVIYFLYYGCGRDFVIPGINLSKLIDLPMPKLSSMLSLRASAIFAGWMGFQVLLERLLPAQIVEGVDLAPAGGQGRLKYRMNGHLSFWVSMAFAVPVGPHLAVLYDEFPALAGASILFSTGLSAYLYAASFAPGALLAKGGKSGNPVYDFFIGRELNPRIFAGTFDLKEFCELRPGLIGWAMLNLGMMAKQFQKTGAVSGPMVLVNCLQGLYVWDSLYHERAILSTMDITTDGFGFMLAFGDIAWVPFTYGLQARYLVDHDPHLPNWALVAIALSGIGSYALFRASNSQKDAFRRDPQGASVKHLEVIEVTNRQTGKPSKLLVSGWWGLARKINYTGDWLLAWTWSLSTGGGTVLTYFYPIYFAILLIHRAGRDDHFCSEKYGEGWKEYKKRVPYIFCPYIL